MRILYGVQGTGNGHLTRARVMAPALAEAGIEVQYLFSSRPREGFFDMQPFGDWWWRRGLTFVSRNGRVSRLGTLGRSPDLLTFAADVKALDLSGFDLVLCDFEPVSAWAALFQGKPVVGLGHQQAFGYPIPKCRGGWLARAMLRYYAPVSVGLGLHWHHFGQPILPPLVEPMMAEDVQENLILVYLPFESPGAIRRLLAPFGKWEFHVYHGSVEEEHRERNVSWHRISRQGFQRLLARASGVICNSGFELISEALQANKKILTRPLAGQWEQCCNAKALQQLGWGRVMARLDRESVARWLGESPPVKVDYPDVASAIVAWLKQGEWYVDPEWTQSLWRRTRFHDNPETKDNPAILAAPPSEVFFSQRQEKGPMA